MGRGWKISGREKFLDFYWCKFEENKSVPVGGGGDLLRCSERKSVWPRYHGSKISGGVCSFSSPEPLGLICNGLCGREWSLLRFSALFTNARSLVPSRPRGFRMWRSKHVNLSKHVNSKVQKRTMKHGNTQNGSKSSLCTDPPSPQEKSEKGSLLKFFLRGEGSVHRLIEIHQSLITVS